MKGTVNEEGEQEGKEKGSPKIPIFKFFFLFRIRLGDEYIAELQADGFYLVDEGVADSFV